MGWLKDGDAEGRQVRAGRVCVVQNVMVKILIAVRRLK
jgi:hypothetical protein